MEEFTLIQCRLPINGLDYKLNLYMAELQKEGVRKTKAQLLMELAEEALLKRTTKREIK